MGKIIDMASRRLAVSGLEQDRINLDPSGAALLKHPKVQNVRKAPRCAPVNRRRSASSKKGSAGSIPTKRLDNFCDGRKHGEQDRSSCLTSSRSLTPEQTFFAECGKLVAMNVATRKAPGWDIDAIAGRLYQARMTVGGGASQEVFAGQAGIKRNRYNQWERAKGRPDLDGAMALCARYNLTLDWIYFGDRSGLPLHVANKLLSPVA